MTASAFDSGEMSISGVDVRYMPPHLHSEQPSYVDCFGLMPLLANLCFSKETKDWDPVNILLTGNKGTGKSLLCSSFAKHYQIPYFSIDCSEETRERHLKGGFTVKDGTTPFILGTVANAIQIASDYKIAMLVLEEINALSPQMQKILNPLTDFRRKVEVPELAYRFTLSSGTKLFVIGTMNPVNYGGSYELNSDLKSRFIEIEIPYPTPEAEKQILLSAVPTTEHDAISSVIEILVTIAQESRQGATSYALSTRDLVQLVTIYRRVGLNDTLFLLAQKFNNNERKLIQSRITDRTLIDVPWDVGQRIRPR